MPLTVRSPAQEEPERGDVDPDGQHRQRHVPVGAKGPCRPEQEPRDQQDREGLHENQRGVSSQASEQMEEHAGEPFVVDERTTGRGVGVVLLVGDALQEDVAAQQEVHPDIVGVEGKDLDRQDQES